MGITYLALGQHVENGLLYPVGMIVQPHMLQHHDTTQQQRRRVGELLALYVRRGPVHRFEDGALIANVAGWCESQPTDQAGAHVGQDIPVQIRHDENLVVVRDRIRHHLQASIVQQLGIELDVGEILGDPTRRVQEESIAHLHDGGFVHHPDFPLAYILRVLEGEAEDSLAGFLRDELDRLDDSVYDDVLDA